MYTGGLFYFGESDLITFYTFFTHLITQSITGFLQNYEDIQSKEQSGVRMVIILGNMELFVFSLRLRTLVNN